ncbi:hypothetical protein GOBAR_AA04477 [Gossypium barbadense]|uniref:Uncharacterized protein n=1 Tax=Gossypium barbadense TaxID=3634 RepID=A0A2P5YKH2_GOSBA|nr:hypothetical protein GOBAR_AA04477 [Gossypium barbadense]
MEAGMEVADMGWNLSLRAQSRRALAMKSIWLREDNDDNFGVNSADRRIQRNDKWAAKHTQGFCLRGKPAYVGQERVKSTINPAPADMEHDQEDGILIGEEGQKRARGENEDEINNSMNRNRRVLEATQRKRKNVIHKLNDKGGGTTEIIKEMEGIARSYFQNLSATDGRENLDHLLSSIEKCI